LPHINESAAIALRERNGTHLVADENFKRGNHFDQEAYTYSFSKHHEAHVRAVIHKLLFGDDPLTAQEASAIHFWIDNKQLIQSIIKRELLRSGQDLFDLYSNLTNLVPHQLKDIIRDLVNQQEHVLEQTMLNYLIPLLYGMPMVDKGFINITLVYYEDNENILAVVAQLDAQGKKIWEYEGDDEEVKAELERLIEENKALIEQLIEAFGRTWEQFLELKALYKHPHYHTVFVKKILEHPEDFLASFENIKEKSVFKNDIGMKRLEEVFVHIIQLIHDKNEVILFSSQHRKEMRHLKSLLHVAKAAYIEEWIKTNKIISTLVTDDAYLTPEDKSYIKHHRLNKQLIHALLDVKSAARVLGLSVIRDKIQEWPHTLKEIIENIIKEYEAAFEHSTANILLDDAGRKRKAYDELERARGFNWLHSNRGDVVSEAKVDAAPKTERGGYFAAKARFIQATRSIRGC